MKKIPYGTVGTIADLVNQNYYYIDRTNYLEKLEELSDKHLFFLRPRRFGKSLFLSVLHHYYGLEHQDKFEHIFGNYYVGKNPTALRNSYFVLNLDFSGINTKTNKETQKDFLESVRFGVEDFLRTYNDFFNPKNLDTLSKISTPENIMKQLWNWVKHEGQGHKVYVLIDEYDQFTNEMVAYHFEEFKEVVGRNGWVRKFYETLKIGAGRGIIDRTFITGVTPITFDSLTSGFSNATDISTELEFCEMMGFTDEEVRQFLEDVGIEGKLLEETRKDLKDWYDGYLFNKDAKKPIYNSEMVLFFIKNYLTQNKYPEQLLATSVASDYHKVRSLFRIGHKEKENLETLELILKKGEITASLTIKFNFEVSWRQHNFVSLLYYLGFLTIKGSIATRLIFAIPNFVIRQLYYQYFSQVVLNRAKIDTYSVDIQEQVTELALHNNIKPLIELTESTLTQLSIYNDRAAFNETHIKSIFVSWFYATGVYHIYSELEVSKKNKNKDKGRIDLLLTSRPPFEEEIPYQFIFELKYLKKKDAGQLETTKKTAIAQLKEYLKDDKIKHLKDLKAYVIVFVANKAEVILL
ncbi:MAG: AAA family ATPase [Chitinophagales bacterium]